MVVSPIGFVSDHLEVVWDLDTEAAATAEQLGLDFVRAATPGIDPRFVAMVRDLVRERLDPAPPPAARAGSVPSRLGHLPGRLLPCRRRRVPDVAGLSDSSRRR